MFLICFDDAFAYVEGISKDDLSDWNGKDYDVIDVESTPPRRFNTDGEWVDIPKASRQIVRPA